jgi:glutamine---fructose-6-phosphate transaminase (isomerizing)
MTGLEKAIRAQPAELRRLAGMELPGHARQILDCGRIWLVGTGTSQHAAELGATMLSRAGLDARPAPSSSFVLGAAGERLRPGDGVIVISHTGESAFPRAAHARAREAGAVTLSITGQGAGWGDAIETVPREPSQTYTVSYLGTLAALALLADAAGAEGLGPAALAQAADAVESAVGEPGSSGLPDPERLLVLTGIGPAAVTAREGALKMREAARRLAEGFDAEYLFHGSAVPLGGRDALVLVQPSADPHGVLREVGRAAAAEGVAVASIDETGLTDPVLSQLPLTARLQLLALDRALSGGQDPDHVITGAWEADELWDAGAPG